MCLCLVIISIENHEYRLIHSIALTFHFNIILFISIVFFISAFITCILYIPEHTLKRISYYADVC